MIQSIRTINPDISILLLRITTGGLMLFHGIHKITHGHEEIRAMLMAKGLPALLWIGVPLSEVVAPILLIVGAFTRISGMLIAAVMVFALYLGWGWEGFTLNQHGAPQAELNLYFLISGIALFFSGGGRYSIVSAGK